MPAQVLTKGSEVPLPPFLLSLAESLALKLGRWQVIHNAYRVALKGPSRRKESAKKKT